MSDIKSSCEDSSLSTDKTPEMTDMETQELAKASSSVPFNRELEKELEEFVQNFKDMKGLPDAVAEIILKKKLNTMILDLYDYERGYAVSFLKFGDNKEIWHGKYSYGVSLIEYIKSGRIPYEILDKIVTYPFKLFYDGYVFCQLRIHFEQNRNMRSHYVLLKHTIQTIDGECSMRCKADENLDFETLRATLINDNSPHLCLDPDPVVAEIVIGNELNQYPFITPYLNGIILKKKEQIEIGVYKLFKAGKIKASNKQESASAKVEDERAWDFRLSEPTKEEVEIAEIASSFDMKWSIHPYLKARKICFPDKGSFTGFHVEIENFVYEYDGLTRRGETENIVNKLCISVIDDREIYYGAYKLDDRMNEYVSFYWWEIGNRELLDLHIDANTKNERKFSKSRMRITHNRLFDERVEVSDGKTTIIREKLEHPVSDVILNY